jgi:hypothetical protein
MSVSYTNPWAEAVTGQRFLDFISWWPMSAQNAFSKQQSSFVLHKLLDGLLVGFCIRYESGI